jgi:hypothetical protein
MLHELLVALWGKDGELFQLHSDGIFTDPTLPLHPGEISLLDRVLQVRLLSLSY